MKRNVNFLGQRRRHQAVEAGAEAAVLAEGREHLAEREGREGEAGRSSSRQLACSPRESDRISSNDPGRKTTMSVSWISLRKQINAWRLFFFPTKFLLPLAFIESVLKKKFQIIERLKSFNLYQLKVEAQILVKISFDQNSDDTEVRPMSNTIWFFSNRPEFSESSNQEGGGWEWGDAGGQGVQPDTERGAQLWCAVGERWGGRYCGSRTTPA